jgi:protein TonB
VNASQASFAKRPSLIYPVESRQAREEGTVVLRITVDARGRPTNVAIIKGSGFPRLDRAAIEGAWRCRIRNAKAGATLDVPLRFDLDE